MSEPEQKPKPIPIGLIVAATAFVSLIAGLITYGCVSYFTDLAKGSAVKITIAVAIAFSLLSLFHRTRNYLILAAMYLLSIVGWAVS